MPAARIRKSAIAMMVVAGGLAAAVSSPPVHAQTNKGAQTIPCSYNKEKKRQRVTIPCDMRKSAKKRDVIPCDTRKSAKKAGVMNPCQAKRRGADKLGDIK